MPSHIAPYYDAVINWNKRLAREMPLLVELAREAGERSWSLRAAPAGTW